MWKQRRWNLTAAIAALATGAVAWLAQVGFALPPSASTGGADAIGCKPLTGYFFGPNLAKAEIVYVIHGVAHDVLIDRGVVKSVSPSSLELRERTGDVVPIQVAPDAKVRVNGRPGLLAAVKRRWVVLTIRDGADAAASCVQAFSRSG